MRFNKEDITDLLHAFDQSDVNEMKVSDNEMTLEFKKADVVVKQNLQAGNANTAQASVNTAPIPVQSAASAEAEKPVAVTEVSEPETEGILVEAPLSGIFYRAASPEAEPYVTVGQSIKKGDVIGLVEAMKMMSEIPSPADGVVKEIRAENGAFVEFQSPLIVLAE